jgi:hypothetical protein
MVLNARAVVHLMDRCDAHSMTLARRAPAQFHPIEPVLLQALAQEPTSSLSEIARAG